MNNIDKLKSLYTKNSKHSNYQVLSPRLASIIGNDIKIKSRYENERLAFILKNIEDFIKNIESVAPEFELYSVLDKPIRTRRRKTILEGNNHNMTFYGFSIIASTLK